MWGHVCTWEHLCVEAGGQSEVSSLWMPPCLRQSLSLAWNSLCRLDRLSSEPGNSFACVSQELSFQVLGIFTWVLKIKLSSLFIQDKSLTKGAIPISFFFWHLNEVFCHPFPPSPVFFLLHGQVSWWYFSKFFYLIHLFLIFKLFIFKMLISLLIFLLSVLFIHIADFLICSKLFPVWYWCFSSHFG